MAVEDVERVDNHGEEPRDAMRCCRSMQAEAVSERSRGDGGHDSSRMFQP